MKHSNAMTAPQLLLDEIHRVVIVHAAAISLMHDVQRHITNPIQPAHAKNCARCTQLALKLQAHQTRIRTFRRAMTKAVRTHYRETNHLDRTNR